MLAMLRECGALARVAPELEAAWSRPDVPERLAARLEHAASRGYSLSVRYALLVLDLEAESAAALAQRVNAPSDCRELATLAIRERGLVCRKDLDAESTLGLLERSDAFSRPDRLDRLLEVIECDTLAESPEKFRPRATLKRALEAAKQVDAGAVARQNPGDIPEAVRRARMVAIANLQLPTGN